MTTIIVNHENNQIDEHDFASEISTITIGRRSTNDVCIPNLSVSGMHAKITISEDGAMIEDLGSTNGTYINGRLISRQLLNDGDDIVMGKTRVTFLQPSQNKPISQPVIVDDNDLQDERPLTLAEKAKIHKTSVRQPSNEPFAAAIPPAASQADNPLDEHHSGMQQRRGAEVQERTEVLGARPVAASSASEQVVNSASSPVRGLQAAASQSVHSRANPSASLDDAVINGFDQIEEPDSSLTHSETILSATRTESTGLDRDMVTLDNDNASASAVIEIKNGAKSGQVLPIDKPVTTLGRPGIQIAAIMKKPEGYFLMHIESDETIGPPKLNKSSIGDEPVLLKSGDALNVAGIDVQFMQS